MAVPVTCHGVGLVMRLFSRSQGHAATSPAWQVMTFGQFRAGLTMPLCELLPATIDLGSTGDVVLLDAEGMLSPPAEEFTSRGVVYGVADRAVTGSPGTGRVGVT